jgi:hypothetical protein
LTDPNGTKLRPVFSVKALRGSSQTFLILVPLIAPAKAGRKQ